MDANAPLNTSDVSAARVAVPELGLELESGSGGEVEVQPGRLVVTLTQLQADGLALGRYRAHAALYFDATSRWLAVEDWLIEVIDNPAIPEPTP